MLTLATSFVYDVATGHITGVAMKPANLNGLIAWQWRVYGNAHQERRNLLLHIVAVPLFAGGSFAALIGVFGLAWQAVGWGLLAMAVGFVLQGIGHRYERHAPPPFASRAEFVTRILTEQFIIFPRFVLSGEWLRRLRSAKR
jgi:uncharacterized membrane protein YGL010W